MNIKVEQLLTDEGYKEYPSILPQSKGTRSRHFQRRIVSERVCETNDHLFINVYFHEFQFGDETSNQSYKIEIIGEYQEDWWDLNVYGLSDQDVLTKLKTYENILVKLFNAL